MAKQHYKLDEIVFAEKPKTHNFKDLENNIFGRLKILGLAEKRNNKHWYWYCLCECGETKKICSTNLLSSKSTSCGCNRIEFAKNKFTTHGERKSPEYLIYHGIKKRCENKKNPKYASYGGRGIKLLLTLEEFLLEIGKRPNKSFSVDRINNEGNYEKGNIRWATAKEQANNTRKNLLLTIGSETLSCSQWAERKFLKASVINSRVNRSKWCPYHAINLKSGSKKPKDCLDCQAI